MIISKNNFYLKVVESFFDTPRTLCGFFWKFVISIFLMISPLYWISRLFLKDKEVNVGIAWGDKVLQVIALVPIITNSNIDIDKYGMAYIITLLTIGAILIIILIFAVIAAIGSYLLEKVENKLHIINTDNKPNVLIESIKSIKSKVCPIIQIKDE